MLFKLDGDPHGNLADNLIEVAATMEFSTTSRFTGCFAQLLPSFLAFTTNPAGKALSTIAKMREALALRAGGFETLKAMANQFRIMDHEHRLQGDSIGVMVEKTWEKTWSENHPFWYIVGLFLCLIQEAMRST